MDYLISRLSEIRSNYNCLDEAEEPYYRALSDAIKKLSERSDEDTISKQAAIDVIAKKMPSPSVLFADGECLTEDGIYKAQKPFVECMEAIDGLPPAQPEQSVAQERYEDLCEYFGNDHDVIKTVLGDRKEFKALLERLKWHVKECNKLSRQLEAKPEIIRCKDCKYSDEQWRRVSVRWLPCMDVKTGSNWFCGSAERREE